jgi:TPP-dependent pyruvate/acetoin dehydrogenase alpha subunit
LLDRDALQEMHAEAAKQVEEAVATAQQENAPSAHEEDWSAMSDAGLIDNPSA